ncbi:MAG TPA: hypothetical protein VFN60_01435 [Acidimicrobiales bacterium]|nr:hypothetical protein [Acidimicrobiales bacterium]
MAIPTGYGGGGTAGAVVVVVAGTVVEVEEGEGLVACVVVAVLAGAVA